MIPRGPCNRKNSILNENFNPGLKCSIPGLKIAISIANFKLNPGASARGALLVLGHTPSTAGTFRKKFRKDGDASFFRSGSGEGLSKSVRANCFRWGGCLLGVGFLPFKGVLYNCLVLAALGLK